ncbi:50S ribosomal protein L20 [Psychrosphaera haliotis]|uniref:50S ribosomal protein L20 n=1 Tax=Psychrosphaera haliotis TaxID=555083 RepID=UPI0039BFFE1F
MQRSSKRFVIRQIHERLEKASIEVNRKILADIAVHDQATFAVLVTKANEALAA